MPSLLSCFGGSTESSKPSPSVQTPLLPTQQQPQQHGHAGTRPVDKSVDASRCVFCAITPDRFNIVLEDDDYICFTDRSPAAQHHLLVVPRIHIANVKSLTAQHVGMVREMQALGAKALQVVSPDAKAERRFGFHIPPFTSVDHLHLHALELPFRSSLRSLKYRIAAPPSSGYHKGWSWFAEYTQACGILADGGRVSVGRC
ncbi:uncharacterized protein PFL1_01267 [Pseudozyma flocculosa PF-1]|uniref:HIT domain-containing protein n=1 Tax=Pseudozyma flocculosa TaxID=84751 RepID=A0A5C3EUB3_9BASI|nr:uncharacterized protein PFL1_01267 [Pseudozyma flocculosa PF-1]EPQ31078.1 hypothetical protein PFL1_01267 [Pseudozyma flocculosa PF-1]SPO35933.1 uncharacterized protein PSFLO_01404 [Pseudozyma flocculosa]